MPVREKKNESKAKAQDEFPIKGNGVEKISIPEIDEAVESLRAEEERFAAAKAAHEACKLALLQAALANEDKMIAQEGNKTYTYENHLVVLKPGTSRVAVKDLKKIEVEDPD